MGKSVFPGIDIMDIRVDSDYNLTGERGSVIVTARDQVRRLRDEYTNRGLEKTVVAREDLDKDLIEKLFGDRDILIYDLKVKSAMQEVAEMKGKGYVRGKNPFEPSILRAIESYKEKDGTPFNTYIVTVGVSK